MKKPKELTEEDKRKILEENKDEKVDISKLGNDIKKIAKKNKK